MRAKASTPVAVIVGALAEHFFADDRDVEDVAKEMHHLLGPGQAAEVAVNDDAVEAVVYQNEQAVEQLCEQLHRLPPWVLVSNKIIGQATGGVKSAGVGAKEGKQGFPKGKKP